MLRVGVLDRIVVAVGSHGAVNGRSVFGFGPGGGRILGLGGFRFGFRSRHGLEGGAALGRSYRGGRVLGFLLALAHRVQDTLGDQGFSVLFGVDQEFLRNLEEFGDKRMEHGAILLLADLDQEIVNVVEMSVAGQQGSHFLYRGGDGKFLLEIRRFFDQGTVHPEVVHQQYFSSFGQTFFLFLSEIGPQLGPRGSALGVSYPVRGGPSLSGQNRDDVPVL
mmetsp:Transcript_24191/g.67024  ORF Transcript_24191/g.67024 Transcript_24191/m.67024 type:complete len:220 (-) Transcript_24191:2208-2867(-)